MTGANSFVAHGLAEPPLPCEARTLHVTVDFEAFTPEMIDEWAVGMEHWAQVAERLGIRCTFFVSVEDAARLRWEEPSAYGKLLHGLQQLYRSGASLQPHSHRMFDLETGRLFTAPDVPKLVPGYAKQASLFYDVRHRHGASFAEWFPNILQSHRTLCEDSGVPLPGRIAFRPGGWDCGSTAEEQRCYLRAIADAGVVLHSGDSHGTYGARSYHIESRFGENMFPLESGVVEIAPCWGLNCGAPTVSPQLAGAMRRLLGQPVIIPGRPGAFVTVMHFDHLFHRGWRSGLQPFSVHSPDEIRRRIDKSMGLIAGLSRFLSLHSALLQDLELHGRAANLPRPSHSRTVNS
jgi:hypothetical protein